MSRSRGQNGTPYELGEAAAAAVVVGGPGRRTWRRRSGTSCGRSRVAREFGGFKQSGIGREHGIEVLDAYTETKTVMIHL